MVGQFQSFGTAIRTAQLGSPRYGRLRGDQPSASGTEKELRRLRTDQAYVLLGMPRQNT